MGFLGTYSAQKSGVVQIVDSYKRAFDVASYVSQLHLSPKTQKRAEKIISKAEQASLTSGKSPSTLVAAAIYIASIVEDERRSQSEISQVTGVSVTTIQIRYKELVRKLNIRKS
jgi:transcription initiation factor TFIIB